MQVNYLLNDINPDDVELWILAANTVRNAYEIGNDIKDENKVKNSAMKDVSPSSRTSKRKFYMIRDQHGQEDTVNNDEYTMIDMDNPHKKSRWDVPEDNQFEELIQGDVSDMSISDSSYFTDFTDESSELTVDSSLQDYTSDKDYAVNYAVNACCDKQIARCETFQENEEVTEVNSGNGVKSTKQDDNLDNDPALRIMWKSQGKIIDEKDLDEYGRYDPLKRYERLQQQDRSINELLVNSCKVIQGELVDTYTLKDNVSDQEEWLLDSGASVHVTNSKHLMFNLRKINEGITTADGTRLEAKVAGDVQIRLRGGHDIWLKDVFYVPMFKANVLSLMKMLTTGTNFSFEKSTMTITQGIHIIDVLPSPTTGLFHLSGKRITVLQVIMDMITWYLYPPS